MRGIIKTARRGYNALNCHPRFCTIDSTKNQLKEYMSGSGTVTLAKTGFAVDKEIVEIEHNLGYQPLFHGWFRSADSDTWRKMPTSEVISLVYFGAGISRPNDNILQLCFYTADPFAADYEEDFDYKYIIYIDPYKDAWS